MSCRLIIFDVDGTLVDSQHDIVAAMDHAFAAQGLTPPSRAATLAIVGLSVPEAIRSLAPHLDIHRQEVIARTFRAGSPAQRLAGGKQDLLYPGALGAVTALAAREHIVLGVATGKSRRGVERLFDNYRWHDHFATMQTADTNPSKPDPGMILAAMAETGTKPAETIMIGDTSFDMAMARAAGATAIGVAWGYHPVAELEIAGAHTIAADFAALLAAIDELTR